MINKTQNQSFGALRFDRGAKKLKGVKSSMEAAYEKVAATHHVFVQDKGNYSDSFRGYPLVTVIAQSKSKVANWVFEKFPASTVLAHRIARRPISRMQGTDAFKAQTVTTKIADAIEKKIPALTSERMKFWGGGAIRVLTLGGLPNGVHIGKLECTPKYAGTIINEALINLNEPKPSSRILNPFWEEALRNNAIACSDFLGTASRLAKPVSFPNIDDSAARRQKAFVDRVVKQVQDPKYFRGS